MAGNIPLQGNEGQLLAYYPLDWSNVDQGKAGKRYVDSQRMLGRSTTKLPQSCFPLVAEAPVDLVCSLAR